MCPKRNWEYRPARRRSKSARTAAPFRIASTSDSLDCCAVATITSIAASNATTRTEDFGVRLSWASRGQCAQSADARGRRSRFLPRGVLCGEAAEAIPRERRREKLKAGGIIVDDSERNVHACALNPE